LNIFWAKAVSACAAARLLYEHGYLDGAANRAYYAMFHAARVALASIDSTLAKLKRHGTVIGRFSKHIVRERGLDPELGRTLNRAFELRMAADYEPEGVEVEEARNSVASAEAFLRTVENFFLGAGR
jgi:uncharacterized protein (UPF0332 family)